MRDEQGVSECEWINAETEWMHEGRDEALRERERETWGLVACSFW